MGNLEDSRLHLEKSLSLKSDNGWGYMNWACYYSKLNEFSKAIENLEKAVELGYDDPEWVESEPLLDSIREHQGYTTAFSKIRKNAQVKRE
ncbi:MAG: hypothetical protein EPO28_02860 [Saprospiraceae bacterium]|nr:MAG: hypothetical protein EPO28_02860 [Saprospiraceae bacterium]